MTTGIAAEKAGMAYDPPRQWKKTVAAPGTPERISRRAITSIIRGGTSTRCTVVCTAHGMETGDFVLISGAAQAEFNSTFRITVVDPNTFTIECGGTTAAATGTLVLDWEYYFARATVLGKKDWRVDNADFAWLGVTAIDNEQPFIVLPGGETALQPATGRKLRLADWFVDVGTAADGVVLLFT